MVDKQSEEPEVGEEVSERPSFYERAPDDGVELDLKDVHLLPEFVNEVLDALQEDEAERVRSLVLGLHTADIADLFEVLPSEQRIQLATQLGEGLEPVVLSELEGSVLEDVIGALPDEQVAQAVLELETDDAVEVLEGLDLKDQQSILSGIAADDRAAIEEGLGFGEETAGRLMQRDLVAIPAFWTVGQTIDFLRAAQEEDDDTLPTDFYDIVVVDPAHRPVGTVPLSRIMRMKRPEKLANIMSDKLHKIDVGADQEDVAYEFSKYHLISAPVVDSSGRLVGVITVDDIVDVIGEEAQEDILALAGVSEGGVNETVFEVTKARFLWLLVNLGTAVLASMVIGIFEGTITEIVALAVLMPIVASMGGNAGTQTMTVAVRALATRELSATNARRIVNKELMVSLLNGGVLAVVIGGVAMFWFGDPMLGGVLAAAMVVNMIVAGLSGILIPMVLDKLNIDPAVASTVFVTTITDVVGFFAFLGLAAAVLT